MRCDKCKSWNRLPESDHYLPEDAIGVCDALPGSMVDINLKTGWDGGIVENIETECGFFCAYYEEKRA